MNTRETAVLIVGGGPAGLLSALLLARAGIPCTLCEQHQGISTHPKAMGITRRTAEIFRQCGLLEEMMSCDFSDAETQLIIWAQSWAGEEWGRAPLPPRETDFSPCAAFHSPQTHTESVLLAALEAEPLADLRFGRRVKSVIDIPSGVEIETVGPEGPLTWRAEWVIAADGASSPIRRQRAVMAEGPGDLGHFLNVYFHADPGPVLSSRRALLYNILREDAVEFFVSVNGRDLWLMHHFLQPGDDPRKLTPEKFEGIIRHAAGVPDLRVKVMGVAPWVMSPKVASAFRSGRVFFTGDAAARLSPAGGLGMNTGLQSAHNLAWKLAAVIRGEAREELLSTYQEERHGVSRAVMHHTNMNSGEVFQQVELALRGEFEGLKKLLAASHRQEEETAFDTGVKYGHEVRLPHAWLQRDGRRISTLDLAGGKFVVLAGPFALVDGAGVEVIRPSNFESPDFAERLGLLDSGALLVRPDGFVAWQKRQNATSGDIATAHLRALRSGGE